MSGLRVTISSQRLTSSYDAVEAESRGSRALMAALGKRGEIVLRAHFLEKDKTPNKNGWRRSHFWNRRIRSNTALTTITDRTAIVDIAAPEIAQKINGGRIVPKEAKNLSLPARREAAGRSPRYFGDNLDFVPLKRGDLTGMLVMKGAPKTDKPYYFLRKSVTQEADPTALPNEEKFESELADEAEQFYARRAR